MDTTMMTRLRDARQRGLVGSPGAVLLVVVCLLLAACTQLQPTPSLNAEPSICAGIASDFGGCSPDRPTYTGTTCPDLAAEWGSDVDRRTVAIINGPAGVDGKAKSARNVDTLVLTSLVLTMRLDDRGLRSSCGMSEFWQIAQRQFSDALRAGAGRILWDGDPVVPFADWLARAKEIVGMIDDGKSTAPQVDPSPSR